MRSSRMLSLVVLLAAGRAAAAPSPSPSPSLSPSFAGASATPGATAPAATAQRQAAPRAEAAPALPRLGAMMDVGLPDGANAALVYRPMRWLRAHAGGGYNMISAGVRGGVTLAPLGWGPSLTLEGGHYFEGNANTTARKFAGTGYKDSALLERVGYDYANAHLGFEIGYRRVAFYLHGGMSYVRATVHNFDTVVGEEATASGAAAGTEVSIKQDPIVRAFTPSAKLGLIVYLW